MNSHAWPHTHTSMQYHMRMRLCGATLQSGAGRGPCTLANDAEGASRMSTAFALRGLFDFVGILCRCCWLVAFYLLLAGGPQSLLLAGGLQRHVATGRVEGGGLEGRAGQRWPWRSVHMHACVDGLIRRPAFCMSVMPTCHGWIALKPTRGLVMFVPFCFLFGAFAWGCTAWYTIAACMVLRPCVCMLRHQRRNARTHMDVPCLHAFNCAVAPS